MMLPPYVLITPARNEAQFIELTLRSVVCQTILPVKWVIVSDGSTDGTDEIVAQYSAAHEWIELVRLPERNDRNFAAKVYAFGEGHRRVEGLPYEIIGNLDGDVSFENDYFEFLLGKFAQNPRLGVGGTPFREGCFQYDYRFTNIEHVSGQIQVFRRECFAEIGGYIPRRIGGIDLVAVTTARMKGWQTRTFLDRTYAHHRRMGTATGAARSVAFKVGRADYILGSHPLWEVARCVYQTTRPPILSGGALLLAGFVWAALSGAERQVPADFVRFRRHEQMQRLLALITRQ